MSKTICLLGALDTKGPEYAFVKARIEERGFRTFVIDVGVLGDPAFPPDVARAEVAKAGGADADALAGKQDRGEAVAAMSRGIAKLLPQLCEQGKFQGVIALGGTGGTSVACSGMRQLPLGIPKVMVSTVAGGDVSAFVGIKDIVMIPSIVDVAGVNRISREVFARAAGAICGMVGEEVPPGDDKPLIVASMFGNTTKAIGYAREILEKAGYEILVFHCTGNGGKTMEELIRTGRIAGVLDMTTTEWADQYVGGVFAAGPDRLSAAAQCGVPAVVTPGCLDMVNFNAPETVPSKYDGRTFYQHNPNVTLMRTTAEECRELGRIVAEKLNESTAPVTMFLPQKGWSVIDSPGGSFWLPEANKAFDEAFRANIRKGIPVVEMNNNINDEAFAVKVAETLLENINAIK